MKQSAMVIVLLLGVACLLLGGMILFREKIKDPFQVATGDTYQYDKTTLMAFDDMTVARVRIDGGDGGDAFLNFQKIRLIAFNGTDIWQSLTATARSQYAPDCPPINAIDPKLTYFYHSEWIQNEWFEVTVKDPIKLDRIEIVNRTNGCQSRLASYTLRVFDTRGDEFFTHKLSADATQVYGMPAYRFPPNCSPWGGRDLRCTLSACKPGDLELPGKMCKVGAAPYVQQTYDRVAYKRRSFIYPPYTQGTVTKDTVPLATPKVKTIKILPSPVGTTAGTSYDGNKPVLNLSYIKVQDIYGKEVKAARGSNSYSNYNYSAAELAEIKGGKFDWQVCVRGGRAYAPNDSRYTPGCTSVCCRPNDADMLIETSSPGAYPRNLPSFPFIGTAPYNFLLSFPSEGLGLNDGDERTKNFNSEMVYISDTADKNPYILLTLKVATWVRSVGVWNRGDCCQDRLQYFKLVMYDEAGKEVKSQQLTAANTQTIQGPSLTCPAGSAFVGADDTNCYSASCPAGTTGVNPANATQCMANCKTDAPPQNGQCKPALPAGFTQNGDTFTQNCAAGDEATDGVTCRKPCKQGETQTATTCAPPCAANFRFIPTTEGKCFPNDASSYLTIAWEGNVQPYVGNGAWCMHTLNANSFADAVVSPNICSKYNQDATYMYGTTANQIVNGSTRMCLDVNNYETGKLVWWPCHGGTNQKWQIDAKNRIASMGNTNKCVTMKGLTGGTIPANSVLTVQDCGGCADGQQIFNFPHKQVQFFTNPSAAVAAPAPAPAKEGFQPVSSADTEEDDDAFREPAAVVPDSK